MGDVTAMSNSALTPGQHDTYQENQRANDTARYELGAQPWQVAGAAERKARARSPSSKNGLPVCVLPTAKPLYRIARPYGQDQTEPPTRSFMPRETALGGKGADK